MSRPFKDYLEERTKQAELALLEVQQQKKLSKQVKDLDKVIGVLIQVLKKHQALLEKRGYQTKKSGSKYTKIDPVVFNGVTYRTAQGLRNAQIRVGRQIGDLEWQRFNEPPRVADVEMKNDDWQEGKEELYPLQEVVVESPFSPRRSRAEAGLPAEGRAGLPQSRRLNPNIYGALPLANPSREEILEFYREEAAEEP